MQHGNLLVSWELLRRGGTPQSVSPDFTRLLYHIPALRKTVSLVVGAGLRVRVHGYGAQYGERTGRGDTERGRTSKVDQTSQGLDTSLPRVREGRDTSRAYAPASLSPSLSRALV